MVAYHAYYPFGEEATAFNQDAEQRKFTGHERDLGSATGAGDDLDYMHARHCSPLTGRFLAVDPSSQSIRPRFPQTWNRYSYVLNNPLGLVDPSGRLWFYVNGEWTYRKGVNQIEQESEDANGNLVITIVAGRDNFLTFDGGTLRFYRQDGSVGDFEARSGELDENGQTQPQLAGVADIGPIPEGLYYFNPATLQSFSDIGMAQQAASLVGRGQWPGGQVSWGQQRAELIPDSSTNTHGRGGFFIHGGSFPGSAGCIDLCSREVDFFAAVPQISSEIPVYVDYP